MHSNTSCDYAEMAKLPYLDDGYYTDCNTKLEFDSIISYSLLGLFVNTHCTSISICYISKIEVLGAMWKKLK